MGRSYNGSSRRNNGFIGKLGNHPVLALVIVAVVVFAVIFVGISMTKNLSKSTSVVSEEEALVKLDKLYKKVYVKEETPRKGTVDLQAVDVEETLPDIDKYPAQVENVTSDYVEIFASVEKTGSGSDGWLVDVGNDFNDAGITVDGKQVSVRVRGMASGMGLDYIKSGKYIPDAYTPSNALWGEMLNYEGVKAECVQERMIGNVPGILLSKSKYKALVDEYGAINLKTITEAVAGNEAAVGYTNPFSSATGLNFLVTTLNSFDSKDLLSETAISGFETFQNNIPFVAYTTLQMKESAASGVLDGFVMEYQTYTNSPELKADYVFTPFGLRHDNPMYAIGNLSDEKKEILKAFIAFSQDKKYQELATKYGFNQLDDYQAEMTMPDGETIVQAQKLWKEKKDGSKPIVAVFVADVSGSMAGEPLNELKRSLLAGMQKIGKDNSIGLVTYSNDVTINLPISKFDINQMSLLTGAVEDMSANGGTATFDAIIVASKMLMEEKQKNPDAKLMLFVLSDGETNTGHTLRDISKTMKGLKIPVYTIGYNADIDALQKISQINEAASINADSDDVVYQLSNLFNSQM